MQAIKRDNLDDQIVRAITDAIAEGEWKPGDRLPSETQLAEMFNTSRPTTRAALQKLNALGILDTRVGQGTFVKEFDFRTNFDYISNLITTPEMQNDVLDFRKTIESACVNLLIDRASDEMITELEQKCNNYCDAFYQVKVFDKSTFSSLSKLDYEFHYTICKLSGNSLLALSYAAAQGTLNEYFYLNVISRYNRHIKKNDMEGFLESAQSHKALVEAIKARDKKKAIVVLNRIVDYKETL
ncbi:MAG: FadR family transcriptional regulator [Oscillospiraceae bacterium]|nr:FadR family transcriptional regulator [Oscillospiraceae bacterium]